MPPPGATLPPPPGAPPPAPPTSVSGGAKDVLKRAANVDTGSVLSGIGFAVGSVVVLHPLGLAAAATFAGASVLVTSAPGWVRSLKARPTKSERAAAKALGEIRKAAKVNLGLSLRVLIATAQLFALLVLERAHVGTELESVAGGIATALAYSLQSTVDLFIPESVVAGSPPSAAGA